MTTYTGFRTFHVEPLLVETLHTQGEIDPWDDRIGWYPNMYVELRNLANDQQTCLGRIEDRKIKKIQSRSLSGIKPLNREQLFLMDALVNPRVTVVVITGPAGTGKTLLTLAAALEHVDNNDYNKVILTRPMSEVGKYKLGALPGDVSEKFGPYLLNYMTNLEQFVGNKHAAKDLLTQGKFDMQPLQLVRGASFNNCLVIADEMQVCNYQEVLTVGTRIGHNSKLIIMGDLNQRDEKIAKDKTGLHKLMNDKRVKESPIVAAIELCQCERSETARLFAKIFEE